MSDSDEVVFDAPTEKPAKKKVVKKKAKARAPAAPKPEKSSVPFPGLTKTICADGCNKSGCVISGKSYCAHPTKGGLQASEMGDPMALKRLQRARDQLSVRIDPDRFK